MSSLEENMKELNETIKELIKRFDANMKFVKPADPTYVQRSIEEVIEGVTIEKSKPKKKTKAVEQPVVVDVPVGNLDGSEDESEQEETVEVIEVETTENSVQLVEVSLEELQTLAKNLVAKDNGDSSRAKAIITKYAEKISMFTPAQRVQASSDLTGLLNG